MERQARSRTNRLVQLKKDITAAEVRCPSCSTRIELNEVLLAAVREQLQSDLQEQVAGAKAEERERVAKEHRDALEQLRAELDEERARCADAMNRELELLRRERELDRRSQEIALDAERKFAEGREEIRRAEETRLRAEYERKARDAQEQLDDMQARLQRGEQIERELRQRQLDLDLRARSLELEVQRRLDETREQIATSARSAVQEEADMILRQKETEISRLRERIADLQRTANQGSQELQGESLEVTLRNALRRVCPLDIIDDVPRGRTGADIHHHVRDASGTERGLVVWEAKDARNWSEPWVDRVKNAQRNADAELAVIVSRTLPRSSLPNSGTQTFTLYRDVWISTPSAAPALALVLRHLLLRLSHERTARESQDARIEILHKYLQSNGFRLQVTSVIDAVRGMMGDLETEQRSYHRAWQRRRQRIETLSSHVAQIVGGLEGATGYALLSCEETADEAQPEEEDCENSSFPTDAFLVLDEQ